MIIKNVQNSLNFHAGITSTLKLYTRFIHIFLVPVQKFISDIVAQAISQIK
jgi:hypothetical protein